MEKWSMTPQIGFHSVYALVGALALLVLVPLAVRKHAKRTGVLTPYEILRLWFAPYCFSMALEVRTLTLTLTQTLALTLIVTVTLTPTPTPTLPLTRSSPR